MQETNLDNIKMYTVCDIQNIFHCGKNQAYQLVHTNGFPKIQIGKKLLVEKNALEKWIEINKGKKVLT